ncbi:hypothetical protein, partial [Roseobacter sp. HKCCA0434]|uniref:hypothetical protein n=1 Tax=Roseobacter sp. HKCCA0434 TaxID=3079297 RepID=UPI002905B7F4
MEVIAIIVVGLPVWGLTKFLAVLAKKRKLAYLNEQLSRNAQERDLQEQLQEQLLRSAEDLRVQRRDADYQLEPYRYQIGRHANETLALRYGI